MLSQHFPQLDSAGGTICEPNDTPLDSRHLDMIYALQTLTDKPYMGSVTSGPNAVDTIRMSEILFGGRKAIEATPSHLADQRQLAAALRRPDAGRDDGVRPRRPAGRDHAVPADGRDVAGQHPGVAGPAAGGGVRRHRAGAARAAGHAVLFGSFLSNTDMQSGSPSFGTPESALSTSSRTRTSHTNTRSSDRWPTSTPRPWRPRYRLKMMNSAVIVIAGDVSIPKNCKVEKV